MPPRAISSRSHSRPGSGYEEVRRSGWRVDGVNWTVSPSGLDAAGCDRLCKQVGERIEIGAPDTRPDTRPASGFPQAAGDSGGRGSAVRGASRAIRRGNPVRKSSILGRVPAFQAASNWSQIRLARRPRDKLAEEASSCGCGSIMIVSARSVPKLWDDCELCRGQANSRIGSWNGMESPVDAYEGIRPFGGIYPTGNSRKKSTTNQ